MAYADLTTRDSNPVKRRLHRRRFADAVAVLAGSHWHDRPRVLDFGAGDGELVRQVCDVVPVDAVVYEPAASLMAEAKRNLARVGPVKFADSLAQVDEVTFDYVFCLEVFEHLPARETAAAIASIERMLKPGGVAVIGVPHELYLPALNKGLFRIARRPVADISPGVPFHFHHLGFDYRVLEALLRERFQLARRWLSPFPAAGVVPNSGSTACSRRCNRRCARLHAPCWLK